MSTASITRIQAQQLLEFCVKHNQNELLFVKKHGAYFMARSKDKTIKNCVKYIRKCDPSIDSFGVESDKFGYCDVSIQLPSKWLEIFLTHIHFNKKRYFSVRITNNSVTLVQ